MASFVNRGLKFGRIVPKFLPIYSNTFQPSAVIVRHNWNKDFCPGPYPKTEAEMVAAAKKYGLLREDYEPYPDDGFGRGDYPKLPIVHTDQKDDDHNWDYPLHKRNFGEPLHDDYVMYTADRIDTITQVPGDFTKAQSWIVFLGMFGLLCSLLTLGEMYPFQKTVMPQQMPNDGRKHYTFEPAH